MEIFRVDYHADQADRGDSQASAARAMKRARRRFSPWLGAANGGLEHRILLSHLPSAEFHVAAKRAARSRAIPVNNLGALQLGQQSFSHKAVGGRRSLDYQFSLSSRTTVHATLSRLSSKGGLILLNASRQQLAAYGNGRADVSFDATLGPGTYFVRVASLSRKRLKSQLFLTATAPPAEAKPIGSSNSPASNPPAETKPIGNPNPPASNPPPISTPLLPATATVYSIRFKGTTFWGNTNVLTSATLFNPAYSFDREGRVVVTPGLSSTGIASNGPNPYDVVFNTGSIALADAGILEYATNTTLHQFFGGNWAQAASLDLAYVTADPDKGTIIIQPDRRNARISQLNTYSQGSANASYRISQILDGLITIKFSDGGRHIEGRLGLFGEGMIYPGSTAIEASFEGDAIRS